LQIAGMPNTSYIRLLKQVLGDGTKPGSQFNG
jgi:hypothetical protein